jgi:hypothetical protein
VNPQSIHRKANHFSSNARPRRLLRGARVSPSLSLTATTNLLSLSLNSTSPSRTSQQHSHSHQPCPPPPWGTFSKPSSSPSSVSTSSPSFANRLSPRSSRANWIFLPCVVRGLRALPRRTAARPSRHHRQGHPTSSFFSHRQSFALDVS